MYNTFVSKQLRRAAPTERIEHNDTVAVFLRHHAVDVVHSSRVCRSSEVDDGGREHRHHALRIAVSILMDSLRQVTAVCFIEALQRVIRMYQLIYIHVDFLALIVIGIERVRLNGFFGVIRHGC